MKYQYIFFDLDGTLLDTLNDIMIALNKTMDTFCYPLHYSYEDGKKLIGRGARILAERALKPLELSKEEVDSFVEAYLPNYLKYQGHTTTPFPNVLDTLSYFHKIGVKMFITTNKPQPMTDEIVKQLLPSEYFTEIIGQSERFPVKPSPEILNYLVDKYSINKQDILYVGDSLPDVEFASNGGLDCVLCLYGYSLINDSLVNRVKYTINDFSELKNIVM